MNEIFTYFVDLPPAVKGLVQPDSDGNYTIYINAIYNEQQRMEIFEHEMRHILLQHHYGECNLAEAEQQAADARLLPGSIRRAAAQGLPLHEPLLPGEQPPPPEGAQPEGASVVQAMGVAGPAGAGEGLAPDEERYYKEELAKIRRQMQTGMQY